MKSATGIILGLVAVVAIAFGVYMIDFDVTEEGRMPDVDIAVDGGELPEVDAEVGTITAGTTEKSVTVPDVDVDIDTKEAKIEVPTISVNPPADGS